MTVQLIKNVNCLQRALIVSTAKTQVTEQNENVFEINFMYNQANQMRKAVYDMKAEDRAELLKALTLK